MTITASRIVAGTSREDDLDIVVELDRRYDRAIQTASGTLRAERIAAARDAYAAASKLYWSKWGALSDTPSITRTH